MHDTDMSVSQVNKILTDSYRTQLLHFSVTEVVADEPFKSSTEDHRIFEYSASIVRSISFKQI